MASSAGRRQNGPPSPVRLLLLPAILVLAWAVPFTCSASAADRLVVLGGETLEAEVQAIAADGQITLAGADAKPALGDLRRLERSITVEPNLDAKVVVHLAGGGSLHGSKVVVREEICRLTWLDGQEASLPIDLVRAIRFPAAASSQLSAGAGRTFEEAVAKADAQSDRLFVVAGEGGRQGNDEAQGDPHERGAYPDPGERSSNPRIGPDPELRAVWAMPRGTRTNVPGPATTSRSPN